MKYIYPALLLLFMASCQKNAEIDHSKTDWEKFKLIGNVESVTEKSYEMVNGQKGALKRAGDHDYDLQFNEEGKLILEKKWLQQLPYEETKYNGQKHPLSTTQYMSGQPVIKTEYQWDKTGNNLEIIKRNPDNSQLSREQKIYKAKDTLVVQKNMYDLQNILTDKTTYEYDQKKNLIKENKFLREETVQYITSYEYDSKKRKTVESSYNGAGTLIYKTVYAYEGDKLASVETINGKDNTSEKVEKYTYDAKGNLLKEFGYNNIDKTESIDEYAYDANNNQTSRTYIKGGKVLAKVAHTYDSKNNLTSTKVTDGEGKILDDKSYAYTYDEKGNWTKKTISAAGIPAFVVERTITYLD
jgi:hypothetical protein